MAIGGNGGQAFEYAGARTFLKYSGPSSVTKGAAATFSATLTGLSHRTKVPVPGVTMSFGFGKQSCHGQTDASGTAGCAMSVESAPGRRAATVTFEGSSDYRPVQTIAYVTVKAK
jgi:hypothetical protein